MPCSQGCNRSQSTFTHRKIVEKEIRMDGGWRIAFAHPSPGFGTEFVVIGL